MKTYDNSINTIQDRTFTFERKIAYRNGDPYIISSELHDPQLVFSLASSKFVKDEKFFKEFYCPVEGNYPTFYQTTPEIITAEPADKSIYFKTGEDKSFCVFKWATHDPEYFYYEREWDVDNQEYTYEEVPYGFEYKLEFPYNITKQFQGIDYVYDLKVVAGISNYEYLVNLLHTYGVDEETFTITIGANTYIFGWDDIGEEWLVNGEKASLLLLLAFAKSYEVKSYIGEDLVNIYLKELSLCKVEEPIVDPDYVEYILKPTAFNVMSGVKGPLRG